MFNHFNKKHPNIKFTIERENQDSSLAMLDRKLTRTDKRIETDIYQKPTNMDQYLQWTSDHPVQHKLGIVRTLMMRVGGRESNRSGGL